MDEHFILAQRSFLNLNTYLHSLRAVQSLVLKPHVS